MERKVSNQHHAWYGYAKWLKNFLYENPKSIDCTLEKYGILVIGLGDDAPLFMQFYFSGRYKPNNDRLVLS